MTRQACYILGLSHYYQMRHRHDTYWVSDSLERKDSLVDSCALPHLTHSLPNKDL